MSVDITGLRHCMEGAIPSPIATCALDGTPNIAYLSQVQYVDACHIALTFQFFNKTRQNILQHPHAVVKVVDPHSGSSYRLHARYLRTETSGPLFEKMKAKLAGIASHTGMVGIFKLQGADVYEVNKVEAFVSAAQLPPQPSPAACLPTLRDASNRLNGSGDLDDLFDTLLTVLRELYAIDHAMVLKLDEARECLFTVASAGYAQAGIGSEIPLGHGVIGVAARERTPIRISHMTSEYMYGKAVRASAAAQGLQQQLETAIPLPGLEQCRSQLAVPILAGSELYGVLYVESPQDLRFGYDDEDALQTLANQFGWMARGMACQAAVEPAAAAGHSLPAPPLPELGDSLVQVRYFAADHSVFLNDDYLIKGVAGAIFWKLVHCYCAEQRRQFSNRELRLMPDLGLPEISDNLEARLVLLQRRLQERQACVQMLKTGRGRFVLQVSQPLLPVAEG
ncbi:GAF domain-containing protein [Vogesella sp. GCM10023246]|uniref:GAF domain-containing protein n=1 Tax=Vogesella oryzagri TaxID=3160864 RepID=A0ABV1M6E4_9NEIS